MMKDSRNRRRRLEGNRKLFAWILCLSMMIDCLPASVMAEEVYGEEFSAEDSSGQYSDDSYEAYTADDSWTDDSYSDDGVSDDSYSDDGVSNDSYTEDGFDDYGPEESWPEEDIVYTEDGFDEEEIEVLFQDEDGVVIDYMPDEDMTYTALWEEEKEPAQIEVVPEAKKLVYTGEPQALIEEGTAVAEPLCMPWAKGTTPRLSLDTARSCLPGQRQGITMSGTMCREMKRTRIPIRYAWITLHILRREMSRSRHTTRSWSREKRRIHPS